ncbi:hypothetical protein MJI46_34285, partial [Salmonella enterica subsp. enterica serovar Cerro]|nr:hypothetical protein [Salmonella enterica subsp. enterica serovar Cerro]
MHAGGNAKQIFGADAVIKVGLHHMPPLLLAGLRFLLVAFPAIFFVARPKVPLTLLLG